jgi:putative nucleotidyltransferase with HDIG domain
MISNIQQISGNIIHGTFRVSSLEYRRAQDGREYISLILEDFSGSIEGQVWLDSFQQRTEIFSAAEKIEITGIVRIINDCAIIEIDSAIRAEHLYIKPLDLIPHSAVIDKNIYTQLQSIRNSLILEPLQRFIDSVFAEDKNLFPFCRVGASLRHHHAQPGGLLQHSVECALIVAEMTSFSTQERELGMVAALFHDLGKIRTMECGPEATKNRMLLNHDILALEILAPHLCQLDNDWPDGALALRYLLTWGKMHYQSSIPAMAVAEAVRCADRISCGRERSNNAFFEIPDWKNVVADSGVKYFRLRQPGSEPDVSKLFRKFMNSVPF